MTTLVLPTRPRVAAQRYTVILDGRRFVIDLDWNGRLQRWMIGLSTETEAIFSGRILATRADLLRQHRYRTDVPPGALALLDRAGLDREPDFESLGADDGHALCYLPPIETTTTTSAAVE